MKVGLDIDGTILENPEFFAALSQSETLEIAIITGRDIIDHDETVKELDELGIKYDDIHYAEDWEDKGRLCKELGIQIMFDDQDEYIEHISPDILVMKPRNGGNWDFNKKSWYTKPPNSCDKKTNE